MVDTLALGASAARRGGSSPLSGTKKQLHIFHAGPRLYETYESCGGVKKM